MKIFTNSYQQLQKDFIRFPEENLAHENNISSNYFDIVYYGRWRRLLISINLFNKLFVDLLRGALGLKREDINFPLGGQIAEFNNTQKNYNELLSAFKVQIIDKFSICSQSFSNYSFFAKCLMYVFILSACIVIGVLLLPVLIIFILVKFALVIKKIDKNLQKNGGFYHRRLNRSAIYVSKKCRTSQFQEMTVSHEHIHLLQAKFCINNSAEPSSYPIENCFPWLLSSEEHRLDNLKYLMHRHETEARLHEIVVHYIRQGNRLPLSPHSFVEMLSQFKWLNVFILPSYTPLPEDGGLITRCESIDLDIFTIISSISNEYWNDYINGVLPVMYANLLGYYGYQEAKRNVIDSIGGIDFYHKLYGYTK